MKKILKRLAVAIGALVVLAVFGVIVKFYALSPASRAAPAMTAPSSPEVIERGRYLAHHVAGCIACHSPVQESVPGEPPVESMIGAGRDFGDLPGMPARIRPGNITPDKKTGLGAWTDGEIVRAMREGVSRDGRALFPQMPYTMYAKNLSDDDALAIVAYLKTLKPIENNPGPTEVDFPVSMFMRAAPQPLEASPPPPPPATDAMARGKWLLQMCLCAECHDSVDSRHQKISGMELAGGMKFPLPGRRGVAIAPNITSDKATGVGAYSDEDLRRAIEHGKSKDGRDLYVMPWTYYRGLTVEDRAALLLALRQVPAVANSVPPSQIK